MDLLIKHGLVLTFENGTLGGRIIPDGAVAVQGKPDCGDRRKR